MTITIPAQKQERVNIEINAGDNWSLPFRVKINGVVQDPAAQEIIMNFYRYGYPIPVFTLSTLDQTIDRVAETKFYIPKLSPVFTRGLDGIYIYKTDCIKYGQTFQIFEGAATVNPENGP